MHWLDRQELEELKEDRLWDKLCLMLEEKRVQAVVRLRTAARQGELGEVRRAEQRVADFEEFLGYFQEEQTDE